MTRVRFLDHMRAVLTEAVLAGAGRILRVRREALTTLRYKPSGRRSPGELVTLADERSDAAMSTVFERHLSRLSPAVGWHVEESGLRGAGDESRRVGADVSRKGSPDRVATTGLLADHSARAGGPDQH